MRPTSEQATMTEFSSCDNLDAYWDGGLTSAERAVFESHLETCSACRDALDEQRWIDDQLRSPGRIQLEQSPTLLVASIRKSLTQQRRKRLRAACGLAAAAVLLIAAGWLKLNREATGPITERANSVAAVEAVHSPPRPRPQATFESTTDAIVIPLESPDPDVTVVQVYPTTATERRWRMELVISETSTISNGG
jgi:anti-sigma factor RsiW